MIIHFNIYNTKTGNFEANPNLSARRNRKLKKDYTLQIKNAGVILFLIYL